MATENIAEKIESADDWDYDSWREEAPDWLNEKISMVEPENISTQILLLILGMAVIAGLSLL